RLEDEVGSQVSEAVADLLGNGQPVRARVLGHAHDDARFPVGIWFDDAGAKPSAPALPLSGRLPAAASKHRMFPPPGDTPPKKITTRPAPDGAGGVVGSKSIRRGKGQNVPRIPIRNVRPGW